MGRKKGSIVVPKGYIWARKLQIELRKKNYHISKWLEDVDMDVLLNHDRLKPVEMKDFELCAKLITKKTKMPISMFFVEQETTLSLFKKIVLEDLEPEEQESDYKCKRSDPWDLWDKTHKHNIMLKSTKPGEARYMTLKPGDPRYEMFFNYIPKKMNRYKTLLNRIKRFFTKIWR